MRGFLEDHRDYLSLLLNTSPIQQKALIDTITEGQVLLLSEIALNLLQLEVGYKGKKFLKSKTELLQQLANKKRTEKFKARIIRNNRLSVLRILHFFKEPLLSLLQNE